MFTPEELRQTDIFSFLDEAERTRLAQTIADVRIEGAQRFIRDPKRLINFESYRIC